ncbi:hypothetical protein [Pseudoalteromonas aliena]|uniref:hypothetical protein n=1 Tax=Pseudoalteromonas aliena TaxID=247523 RepID=UPI001866C92F|nr:hypothetical protein [Pseudoalteromonas aliena]
MFWKIGTSKHLVVWSEKDTDKWCHFNQNGNVFRKSISGVIINASGKIIDKLEEYRPYSVSDTYGISPLYNVHEKNLYKSSISQTGRHNPDIETEILYTEVIPCSKSDIPLRYFETC